MKLSSAKTANILKAFVEMKKPPLIIHSTMDAFNRITGFNVNANGHKAEFPVVDMDIESAWKSAEKFITNHLK